MTNKVDKILKLEQELEDLRDELESNEDEQMTLKASARFLQRVIDQKELELAELEDATNE